MRHHLKGLYTCLNFIHATNTPKPMACSCGAHAPRPHTVDCSVHLQTLADTRFTVPVLQGFYDMGWQLEEMPPLLKSKEGLAFTMGRDCRMNRIAEHPILDIEPTELLPANA